MAVARWFVLFAQMSEKYPDLQVPRCGNGGLMPVCCGRALQTSEQTFAGEVQGRWVGDRLVEFVVFFEVWR